MRLEDADIDRDNMNWVVECDECHAEIRWIGSVKLRGLRVLDDGSLGWTRIRVCRECASRALLLPERRPFAGESPMSSPYVRPVEADPHDREDEDYPLAQQNEQKETPNAGSATDAPNDNQ